jgi:GNAT superfamily N-acetyltransferase
MSGTISYLAKREYSVRRATLDDVATIVEHRRGMLQEIRVGDLALLDTTLAAFEQWCIPLMISGRYLGWLALSPEGKAVSGIGLWLQEWVPTPRSKSTLRGYILNVYTDPGHRKQGLARRLTQTTLDWCRSNGIEIIALHASQYGRPLYESLGFENTSEMRLVLKK